MKKSFEYDLTKYDPNAPTRTEQFLTADGVKTLTTDAKDGAVLIQDSVDGDSLNPVTAAAVATAIEQGGGGGGVPDVADPLYVNPDDAVALRFGSGLTLEEGEEIEYDTLAVSLSGTGGLAYDDMEENALAVQLDPAGGIENFIDDGVQVGLRVNVDGTTIQVNGNNELEAIGGGGGSYTAGEGIKIENNAISVDVGGGLISGRLEYMKTADLDTSLDEYSYLGLVCRPEVISVSDDTCSINFEQYANGFGHMPFIGSCSETAAIPNVMPYFYNRADHSKYVTCESTVATTPISSSDYPNLFGLGVYNSETTRYVVSMLNLTLDTTHAGAGFALDDLTTDEWCLGFHCTGGLKSSWDSYTTPMGTYVVPFKPSTDRGGYVINSLEIRTGASTQISNDVLEVKPGRGLEIDYDGLRVSKPIPAFNAIDDNGKFLTINGGWGLGWAFPVPTYDTSTDVGKVLTVTANGLAWVTPS